MQVIRAAVFDVGETLIDDTREWKAWAKWLGVPAHTLSALVGAVTAHGLDNVEALRLLKPGFDLAVERRQRESAGEGEELRETDLYLDVRPALANLQQAGLWVGIAGNQTAKAAELLASLELPADAIATSGQWGVAKPDTRFFEHVAEWAGLNPHEIVYVGDNRDHDVLPARAAGFRTALVRRGPWGYLWSDTEEAIQASDWRISTLNELPGILTNNPSHPSS